MLGIDEPHSGHLGDAGHDEGMEGRTEVPEPLIERVRAWIAADPDPVTAGYLTELLERAGGDRDATAELADRFGDRLHFGTAGLRGPMAAGPASMNRVTVRLAAAGLGAYLPDGSSVVIGFDGRRSSDVFAIDTARVLLALGHRVLRFPKSVPTPLLAFASRHFGSAGVMITASHNPKDDNGMKVYLDDGAQLIPPADAQIEMRIGLAMERLSPSWPELAAESDVEVVGPDVVEAYLTGASRAVALRSTSDARARLRIVHTAMHGVGTELAIKLLRRAGFSDVRSVPQQADPDPDFPTVAFPNPEEPGALDLALALAREAHADLVLANDPDADRLAVGVPTKIGEWRVLRGDEVGWLLADHLQPTRVATTIVSSSLLRAMAVDRGWTYAETLTGFKWLARTGAQFAYEEALGYAMCDFIPDKDGLTAALAMADLAACASPVDRLAEIEARYGRYATGQLTVRQDIPALMARARSVPHPTELAGAAVARWRDLKNGEPGLPPSDVVIVELTLGETPAGRVIVRPSGTEPKAKVYLEAIAPHLSLAALESGVEAWLRLG